MARAETIGENDNGNGALACSCACRMELSRPLHVCPSLLSAGGMGVAPPRRSHQHLEPLQALQLANLVTYSQTTPQQAAPADNTNQSKDASDSGSEEEHDTFRRQGPLPDLLPQNVHPSWAAVPHQDGPEAEVVFDAITVANQLRLIGDQFNARLLRRAHAVPDWLDWRDVCRGVATFLRRALSTLHRLT